MDINLADYDIILINSSGGKDSQAMLDEVFWQALRAGVVDRLVVAHADLGRVEWKGTKELAQRQAQSYGIRFIACRRELGDLLDYIEERGMWPDSQARYCTSDFKRGPIRKVMTALVAEKHLAVPASERRQLKILNCMGMRKQESPKRAKMQMFTAPSCKISKRPKKGETVWEGASNGKRLVYDYLPIHDWTEAQVWDRIRESGVEYHPAYDLGMPRLSCVFCVFAPKSALIVAGRANPELLDEYIRVEDKIKHLFRKDFSLHEVRDAIRRGDKVEAVESWAM